jgi:hypothetical protein
MFYNKKYKEDKHLQNNKLSWILILSLILCSLLLIVGWFGIPYYVGNQIKRELINLGAPADVAVIPSYWKQQVNVKNLVIIPPSPSFIKKIIVPEVNLSYSGGFLLHGHVNIINISNIEIWVPNTQINLNQALPFNRDNIKLFIKILPKEALKIEALVFKQAVPGPASDNTLTLTLSIKPKVIIKHHYKMHIVFHASHMSIVVNQQVLEGKNVKANLSGTLKLDDDLLFAGTLKLNTQDSYALPLHPHLGRASINSNIDVFNNQYLLKGHYKLDKKNVGIKPVADFKIQSSP